MVLKEGNKERKPINCGPEIRKSTKEVGSI